MGTIRTGSLRSSAVGVKLLMLLAISAHICLCSAIALSAQTSGSPTDDASTSRTDTIESLGGNVNPTRTVESHTQSGNRTVDNRSIQRLGASGNFEPYQDIETETVKVNATTVRTTTRAFGRDADGAKTLVQVTEEESHVLPGGGSSLVRSTSNPDANGGLQLVQRQIEETKKIGKDVEETRSTVLLPGGNGELAPAMKVQERRQQGPDGKIESQKTTLLPDGNGNWQVGEVKQTTIRQDGKNRSSEETISRSDLDGNLGTVSRTVSKESEGGAGVTQKTVETYSADVPGSARDGSLHPVQRITTTQRASSTGGQTTEQHVEQPVPGDSESGLRVTTVTIDTLSPSSSGAHTTRTTQVRDANDSLAVVSVDTGDTSKSPAVQVQIAPAQKPK